MKLPEELPKTQEEPPPRSLRLEEARRIIDGYAADLREIIKKLRGRPN